jgi:hypothetical protein
MSVGLRVTGHRSTAAAAAAISLLTVASAAACPLYIEPRLADARDADVVLVGYVTKDVREVSPARKAGIETWLADNPDASRQDRRKARNATDRARLTVAVDHTIAGAAPSTVTVYWDEAINNGPPDRIDGGYVFALRKAPPSASAERPDAYAVMQQGSCSGALVFRRGSPEANAIREMFGLWPEPLEKPRKTFADFIDPPIGWPALMVYGLLAAGAAFIGLVLVWPRRPKPRA